MEHNTQFLETEPVGRLMHRYAIPCVISLLVGALYNIVDQIFIANASYLGSYGNAANTVVFPLTVVALAIAVMIGDGCCTFVSISLGKGQREDARRAVGNAVVLAAGSGLVRAVPAACRSDPGHVRRHRQCRDLPLFAGVFLLHLAGHPLLYVRSGHEPRHPGRRRSPLRHDIHAGRSGGEYPSGSHLHLRLPLGHDGGSGGHRDRAGNHGRTGRLVSAPDEGDPPRPPGSPAPWQALLPDADTGHHQLPLPDQSGGRHGRHQQYAAKIRRSGPGVRAGTVCPDPHGGGGHRHEVLPDCHLHRGGHGRRVHPHRGL